ncbi:MAG: hypothetical protein LBJ67_00855 [Planctomycetaceae bacterium]|nr:hypothetical protein [Planctomycetaceae bacterium]
MFKIFPNRNTQNSNADAYVLAKYFTDTGLRRDCTKENQLRQSQYPQIANTAKARKAEKDILKTFVCFCRLCGKKT